MLGNCFKLLAVFERFLNDGLKITASKIFYFLALNTNKMVVIMLVGKFKVGMGFKEINLSYQSTIS